MLGHKATMWLVATLIAAAFAVPAGAQTKKKCGKQCKGDIQSCVSQVPANSSCAGTKAEKKACKKGLKADRKACKTNAVNLCVQTAGSQCTTTTTVTTTTSPSTTTTTIGGACCGGGTRLSFTTVPGNGNCGELLSTGGAKLFDIKCGGLYFGGGQDAVPLPAIVPDKGQSITKITSCTGQAGTLGHTTQAETGSNRNCTGVGCLFGAPLPIPNYSSQTTSTCVINSVSTDAVGTVDCATGASNINLPLSSALFLTGDLLPAVDGVQPCPICTGTPATCQGGANNGMPCTPHTSGAPFAQQNCCIGGSDVGKLCAPNGTATCTGGTCGPCTPYPTSYDCPPPPVASIGSLPIGFNLTSGMQSQTGIPNGTQQRVFCGYCRDADDTGVFQNAPKACTSNAGCTDLRCVNVAMSPNVSTTTPCNVAGVQDVCPVGHQCVQFESCEQRNQGAFGSGSVKTINTVGTPSGPLVDMQPHVGKLVSIFCIPHTFTDAVDSNADLPGPGATALEGQTQILP